uniref:Uncharacterized protein n=1 Tax=Glossina austeni TaxID=7395 RepID=A0A1A9VLL1_GLOAU
MAFVVICCYDSCRCFITVPPETSDGDGRDVTVAGWCEGSWLCPGCCDVVIVIVYAAIVVVLAVEEVVVVVADGGGKVLKVTWQLSGGLGAPNLSGIVLAVAVVAVVGFVVGAFLVTLLLLFDVFYQIVSLFH